MRRHQPTVVLLKIPVRINQRWFCPMYSEPWSGGRLPSHGALEAFETLAFFQPFWNLRNPWNLWNCYELLEPVEPFEPMESGNPCDIFVSARTRGTLRNLPNPSRLCVGPSKPMETMSEVFGILVAKKCCTTPSPEIETQLHGCWEFVLPWR